MGLLSGWQEVARVDLARRARDPLGFAIWLGIPLVIAGMLQLAFGGGGGDGDGGGSPKADVLLAVPDEGFLAQMAPFLLSGGGQAPLEVEAVSVEAGRERIALGEADAYVELPADFLENLFNDEPQTVAVLTHPARRVGPALVTGMLEALVEMQRLSQQILGQPLRELVEREADAFANGPNPANVALVGEVFQGVMDRSAPLFFPPALTLERIEPPEEVADEEPAGLSGMVLIFFPSILFLTLFFLAGGLAEDLWTEKSAGTLARALATPLQGPAWALGKLAGTATLHALVALGAFALAIAALGLPFAAALRGLPWAIACGVALSAFMLFVQSLAASARGGSLLGNLVTLPLLMLGGAFFPFEAMPDGLAALGARLPNGWMLLQLKEQLSGNLSAAQLALNFAALAAGTAVLWALVGWRLNGAFGKGGA